jgi:ribonuclease HI
MRTFYCDGSAPGNGSEAACGGWAWLEVADPEKNLSLQTMLNSDSGNCASTIAQRVTSIRMELTAVIQALSSLSEPSEVNLYSDSAYVINGLKQKWYLSWFRTGKNSLGQVPKNLDLWHKLAELDQTHRVHPYHIKGHNGHRWQEMVDSLALAKARELEARMKQEGKYGL